MVTPKPARSGQAVTAADLSWKCSGVVLAWRGSGVKHEASSLFARIAECEPQATGQNKFATPSMPCRSWAFGVVNGTAIDLRLGVDGVRCELHVTKEGGDEIKTESIAVLQSLIAKLDSTPGGPLAGESIALELQLADMEDAGALERWLGHAVANSGASISRHAYSYEMHRYRADLQITALRPKGGNLNEIGMVVAITANAHGAFIVHLNDLLAVVETLLSAPRFSHFSA